ncbi:MAG: hypothetical protein HYR55_13910 [Acidobacteria bacterium]|nr:hypothetical protein [Acidobacteriota bacterium]MBI3658472.1 hypothetical protein [Acidobacteriota bacterium]
MSYYKAFRLIIAVWTWLLASVFLVSAPAFAQFRVYVANSESNNVSVIDTATNRVIATVDVGSFPDGAAASPDGTRVYVSNMISNNV